MQDMSLTQLVWAIIAAFSVPSGITGFCFWLLQRKIQTRDKKRDEEEKERRLAREKEEEERRKKAEEKEKLREKQEFFFVQGISAALSLGEATARAVQRIPDAHCNGDMHKALGFAEKVKHEQKDFLAEQGIHSLYE